MLQKRPMQDSNLQSSAPEADALSIRPIGHLIRRLGAPYVPPLQGRRFTSFSVNLDFPAEYTPLLQHNVRVAVLSMSMQCFMPA